mgnify:CR=1 FL=1
MLLLVACAFTAVHIYRGSRAAFAITLVCFSTGFALYDIVGCYFMRVFTYNFYMAQTVPYIYYMLFV